MDKFTEFFSKNDNYQKAKKRIRKVKENFDGFVIAFPDVTSDEILFMKNKWETIPKKIAHGVKIMALKFSKTYKTFFSEYTSNAYIVPHRHISEYEMGIIIRGSVTDKLTGITYQTGDTYNFSPNELHYLHSENGCLVYSALTNNAEYKLKPLTKSAIKRLKTVQEV